MFGHLKQAIQESLDAKIIRKATFVLVTFCSSSGCRLWTLFPYTENGKDRKL
jgi:hypothetical protein